MAGPVRHHEGHELHLAPAYCRRGQISAALRAACADGEEHGLRTVDRNFARPGALPDPLGIEKNRWVLAQDFERDFPRARL